MNQEINSQNSNQREHDSTSERQAISGDSQGSDKLFKTPQELSEEGKQAETEQLSDENKGPRPSQSKPAILSQQTQQTIMEIIHALKSYTSPDNADLLFKTLVETSQTIDQKNKDPEVESEEKKEAESKQPITLSTTSLPSVSYEDQL